MLTAAGSGFSQWNGLELTRWREDTTRDCHGSFVFLRGIETASNMLLETFVEMDAERYGHGGGTGA